MRKPELNLKLPADRQGKLILLLVTVFLASFAGLMAYVRNKQAAEAARAGSIPLDFPQQEALNRQPTALPPDRLGTLKGLKPKSELDRLIELFAGVKDDPAARSFMGELEKQPELKQIVDDFKVDQSAVEPRQRIEDLAEAIGEKAAFRELTSRFNQEPGFHDVLVKLSENPRAAAIIQRQVARLEAEGRGRKQALSASLTRAGGARAASGAWGGLQSAGGTGVAARQGLSAAQGQTPAGQTAAGDIKNVKRWTSGDAAHDVDRLKKLEDVKDFQTKDGLGVVAGSIRDWLSRNGLSPEVYLASGGGFWDVCLERRELSRCSTACQAPPQEISGTAMCTLASDSLFYWKECLKIAGFDEERCLELCGSQNPPCMVDPETYKSRCQDPLCANPMSSPSPYCRPIPTQCDGSGPPPSDPGPDPGGDIFDKASCLAKHQEVKASGGKCVWRAAVSRCTCYLDDNQGFRQTGMSRRECARPQNGILCGWDPALDLCRCINQAKSKGYCEPACYFKIEWGRCVRYDTNNHTKCLRR